MRPMRPVPDLPAAPQGNPRTGFHHIQPLVLSATETAAPTAAATTAPTLVPVHRRAASETGVQARAPPPDSASGDPTEHGHLPGRSPGSSDDEYLAKYGTKTASGNSRIFNCKQCNRAFTREEHLTRHTLSTHNKLKPFVCGICSRPFSRRDLLLRHAKNLHQGSELAVNRIRKLYKRSKKGSDDEQDDENEDDEHEDDDHESQEAHEHDASLHLEDDSGSTDHFEYQNDSENGLRQLSSLLPIEALPFSAPDKKRMKMSVNMLVS